MWVYQFQDQYFSSGKVKFSKIQESMKVGIYRNYTNIIRKNTNKISFELNK